MANIVISGDTSGSVTLSAPAVSGSTVLTLPTTSGTLVVTGGAQTIEFAAGSAAAPSITFTGDTNTGIFSPAADTIAFTEGGVESMRIDSSGNLGIGTSSPSHKITLGGQTGATATPLALRFSNDFSNTATAASSKIFLYNDGTAGNTFGIGVGQSGDIQYHAGSSGGAGNGNHRFYTNDSERMRIDSSGNLLVGTTDTTIPDSSNTSGLMYAPGNFLGVATTIGGNANLILNKTNSSAGNTILFRYNGGNVGSVSITSTTTTYNTSSDYRLKENIAPMTSALAVVSALKPVTYKWKSDGSDGQGFIAHELQEVVPDCVSGEKDAVDKDGKPVYQGIDTSFLVATLTAAIQEQQAIITDLKTRIELLEGTK
jgi:hypothetical protein